VSARQPSPAQACLVAPGSRVRLDDLPTDTVPGVPASRAARKSALARLGPELDTLQDLLVAGARHKVLVVLQGMDTAGKDGTIRHVFGAVDPLGVRAVAFKAPVGDELAHDYLWRVHRQVPGAGEMVIFNRSHYEDVLIVHVLGHIDVEERDRRLRQITDFERMLSETGTVILKFFLHLSHDEQRRRLRERIDRPEKRWKFNPGDLEQRQHWDAYQRAYETALAATSTAAAPWFVIPADSKSTRNYLISAILRDALVALDMQYPAPAQDISGLVVT
jgi:PPK2 family polyphosphate:nucleotide phosphotransferase